MSYIIIDFNKNLLLVKVTVISSSKVRRVFSVSKLIAENNVICSCSELKKKNIEKIINDTDQIRVYQMYLLHSCRVSSAMDHSMQNVVNRLFLANISALIGELFLLIWMVNFIWLVLWVAYSLAINFETLNALRTFLV